MSLFLQVTLIVTLVTQLNKTYYLENELIRLKPKEKEGGGERESYEKNK